MVARMAELSTVVKFFSRPFRTADGRTVYGVAQVPTRQPRVFDGTFVPRLLFKTAPDVVVPQGTLLTNNQGEQYICVSFTEDSYFSERVKHSYVLMLINASVVWTRSTSTVEPISGLGIAGPDTQLGTIPCVMESTGVTADLLKVNAQTYKILSNQPIQLGDKLNGMTVKAMTDLNGVVNAHVY
jgi:hypothetical protein